MSGIRRKRSSSSMRQSPSISTRRRKSTTIDFGLNNINQKNNPNDDEVIDSDDESSIDSNDMDAKRSDSDGDEEEKETVDEKRIRLAKQYLAKMKQAELEDEHSSDDDDDSSDGDSTNEEEHDEDFDYDGLDESERLSKRLERERLKKQGILERLLAKKIKTSIDQKWDTMDKVQQHQTNPQGQAKAWVQHNQYKLCRGHDLTPTCVALHVPTGSIAYSASKDNSVIMWDIETQSKLQTIVKKWNPNKCDYTRNSGEVLAMAASDDGRFLAVGGRDATVKIYDVRQKRLATTTTTSDNKNTSDNTNSDFEIRGLATTFEGHKGPVTALAFRSKSLQLFSGSNDRCIRHYNLQELAYIETLYGHQAPVTGISCYGARQEVPFSVGRDRTTRAWKIAEETHLIFRGGGKLSSADCISSIKDDWFLTGHDDGVLNLWTMTKKKAVGTEINAHGCYGTNESGIPRGICCVDSIGGSDLAVTGSNDGYLRFWNVSLFLYCSFLINFSEH